MALASVQAGGCVASGSLWKSERRLRRSPAHMVVTLVTCAAEPSARLDLGLGASVEIGVVALKFSCVGVVLGCLSGRAID